MWARTVVTLVAVLLAASCGGDGSSAASEPHQSTTASPTLLEIPENGTDLHPAGPPLRAGTYRVPSGPWSIVDYTITIPKGWRGHNQHYLSKHEDGEVDGDESDSLVIYPVLVDKIFADPCPGQAGPTVAVGPKVNDLIEALQEQPGPVTSEPVETTIGGLPATRIDLKIPKGADLTSCSLSPGLQIWYSAPSDKYYVLMPGYTARIYVVDVDGERQVFLTQHGPATSDKDLRELQSMLDSIRID